MKVQIETSAWSLLDSDPSSDTTGKTAIEKEAMEELIRIYEKEKSFEILISQPVSDELNKSAKPARAKEFIIRHNLQKLEYDTFDGFILGSHKHGILGKSRLGAGEHPDSRLIDFVIKPSHSKDKDILKHNINNEVEYLITFDSDFDKPKIKHMSKLPSEFLKEIKSKN